MKKRRAKSIYTLILIFSIIINSVSYSFADNTLNPEDITNILTNESITNSENKVIENIPDNSIHSEGDSTPVIKPNEENKTNLLDHIAEVNINPTKSNVNINESFIYKVSYKIQNNNEDTCELVVNISNNLDILDTKKIKNSKRDGNKVILTIDTSNKELISNSIDIEVKFKENLSKGSIAKSEVILKSNNEISELSSETILDSIASASISSDFNVSEVIGKEEFIYNLNYNIIDSDDAVKIVINIPNNLIEVISSTDNTENNDILNKEITDKKLIYTLKGNENLNNNISITFKFKDSALNESHVNIISKVLTSSNSMISENTSKYVKLNKPLINFKIKPTKEMIFGSDEFDYIVSYEMISSNQDTASIIVTIPKELEIISFENKDVNIIEQKYEDNKIFYTLNTKDITNIKGDLIFKVKFKAGTKDGIKSIVEASTQYPSEYIISSNPVIFSNFSVADVNITSTENKVEKGEEFSYIVNFTSQGNKDPLKLVINISDNLEILSSKDLVGIKPTINHDTNTITFEIPASDSPIAAQFEISVRFKSNSQNGDIGNASASITKDDIELSKSNSLNTLLETKSKIELIKNMINSTSIAPNTISKYRIAVKNKEQTNLRGFIIKDILPKEAIFIEAKLKDSKLQEIPNTTIEQNDSIIEVKIPREYTESNIYLEVTVQYKDVKIGESITNTAEIYDNSNNYINKAAVTNLVQEKQGQGVISKLATSRVNSFGGAQGWNIYLRNDGNVSFDKFILEDNIPYENHIYLINSGKYEGFDANTKMNINIETNKGEIKNVATLLGEELSAGKSINLRDILKSGEYMVRYEAVIENIPVGFTYSDWSCMRLDGNVRNKHKDGTFIKHNEKITNTAILEYINDEIKNKVKDSDSFLFKSAYTAYTKKNIIKRSTKINDTAQYELLVKPPKRNLPKPIIFDILPDGMEFVDYKINVIDINGNSINSPLKNNFKFEQVQEKDKNIIRWTFNDNLPQNYSISINLTLKQIKNKSFVFNEMGVSTQDINGEIKGVYNVTDDELNIPIDKLQSDTVEPIGYDYDGNKNKGGDIYASAAAQYDIGNNTSITNRKYIKNNSDSNYSTNITSKKGSIVNYRLEIENTSYDEIKDISLIDILPSIGDKNVLTTSDRGSLFNPILVNKFNIYSGKDKLTNDVKISYSESNDPERNAIKGIIGSGLWSDKIDDFNKIKSLKFDFNNLILKPNDKLIIEYSMIIPKDISDDIYAINSFQASFKDIRGNLLYPVESNKVIVKTPTESDKPVVPLPPIDPDKPVVPLPPINPDKPVVPPTDPDKPVVPPTEPNKPVVPPTEPNKPVVPPTELDKPFKITIDDITEENMNPKTGDGSLLIYIGVSSVCLILFIIINRKNIKKIKKDK